MAPVFCDNHAAISMAAAATTATTTSPIATTTAMVSSPSSLKRSRFLPPGDPSVKRARRCVADATDSSEDEDLSSSSPPAAKKRALSGLVVPATHHHFNAPPSPPHSSTAFGEFDRAVEFYSDSDDGSHNKLSVPPRRESINVASLRRRASMLSAGGNGGLGHRKRKSLSVSYRDITARARCFEYLVSSIDEVWAQYCSFTSYAEDEMYNEERPRMTTGRKSMLCREPVEVPNSPTSLYDEDGNYSSTNESQGPMTPYSHHESTFMSGPTPMGSPKCANSSLAPSEQPDSVRLLNVKKRLMNAKYFLQDLCEREEVEASQAFWTRWDMVKYTAIELVEEDGDDDEIVEQVTEELEEGRHYSCNY